MIELSRLQFAERAIVLEGKQFTIKNYPMFRPIYTEHIGDLLLKCSRQVGKTITEHNLTYLESVAIPGFRTLYVSPSKDQTSRYSKSKYGKTLKASPILKALLLDEADSINVSHHLYGNGSETWFSYAGDDADRIRGISCDRINYDEIQDIPYDGVVPVINECVRASDYKYITYAGTPKSIDNTIEYLWMLSTQEEWVVRCDACGSFNMYTNLSGLGKKGPICLNKRCGSYVNPYLGRWVAMNPTSKLRGFHISQVTLPENCPITARNETQYERRLSEWNRIMNKLESGAYSENAFLNEVLGVSVSSGTRLISLDELKDMSDNTYEMPRKYPPNNFNKSNYRLIAAGVDWGGNGKEGVSRTALVISALTYTGVVKILYYKIYPIENPLDSMRDIIETIRAWGVSVVAADAGGGTLANPTLRQAFGYANVFPIAYGVGKDTLKWDDVLYQGCYQGNRTSLIDNYALELKKKNSVVFPRVEDCTTLFNDVLALFEEETRHGKKIWQRHPKTPDDGFHAQLYAWLAIRIRTQNFVWYVQENQ